MLYLKTVGHCRYLRCVCSYIMKPPNILLRARSEDNFIKQKTVISSILKKDRYTIYCLDDEKFYKQPWYDACVLLLFEYNDIITFKDEESKILRDYLMKCDGKILFHGDSVDHSISSLLQKMDLGNNVTHKTSSELKVDFCKASEGEFELLSSVLKKNLTVIPENQLCNMLEDLGVELRKTDTITATSLPAYFKSIDPNTTINHIFNLNKGVNKISGDKLTIYFNEDVKDDGDSKLDESIIKVFSGSPDPFIFNWELYKNHIKTKHYGKNIIFKNVIDSTQAVFTKLRINTIKVDGLVITAGQQTKGKGRSGNQWLSPIGCVMFSIQINIPQRSLLGQRLSYIQHIAVVAFVKSIKERNGYEALDLNIKWPNDIYINGNVKIGGVIVNSSLFDGNFKVIIGLGVNLSNEKPTECVNRLIREHNQKNGLTLQEIGMEEALAGTINKLEYLVNLFQKEGLSKFKEEYYLYWMHDNAEVTVEVENNAQATVIGVDDFGYLLVKLPDGKQLGLQPDGNSFDMMRNMITMKK